MKLIRPQENEVSTKDNDEAVFKKSKWFSISKSHIKCQRSLE